MRGNLSSNAFGKGTFSDEFDEVAIWATVHRDIA